MRDLFVQELEALLREGGWIFGGLLGLAFGIAMIMLSIHRLMRFPEAPQIGAGTWNRLLRKPSLEPAEEAEVRELISSESEAGEVEFYLFGKLRRRFPFAFTLISAAPLLGLLGTVSGMFATFHGLSLSATQAPVDVISKGISEALITTQTGLVIAVPSFIACSLLKVRADQLHASFRRLVLACRHGGNQVATAEAEARDAKLKEPAVKPPEPTMVSTHA